MGLYVNGIPLVVIEAKRPTSSSQNKSMVAEGISQHNRNQKVQGIQTLYAYSQLLLSISASTGRTAASGSSGERRQRAGSVARHKGRETDFRCFCSTHAPRSNSRHPSSIL
jgi:type I site-specific restriction-modification system R (restriction) subunit